jgi:hypothetical protein
MAALGVCTWLALAGAPAWAQSTPAELTSPAPPPTPIIGGEVVPPGAYPYVVALLRVDGSLCTGTVIGEQVVLTAAHCLRGLTSPDQLTVAAGDDLRRATFLEVTEFAAHPDFCSLGDCERDSDLFDYGYVRTAARFGFPATGFPRMITAQDEWDAWMRVGAELTIVGFGESQVPSQGAASIGTKRSVTVPLRSQSASGIEFLAGKDGRDSCSGDSGGPALLFIAGAPVIAGVLSRGSEPCGAGGIFGVPPAALCFLRDAGALASEPACGDCDCLDTRPPRDDGGCHVPARSPAAPAGLAFAVVLLGLAGSRRRRASAGARPTA